MHTHLRQKPYLETAVRDTAAWCAGALVMPNTVPPIVTAGDLVQYREEILIAAGSDPGSEADTGFTPLMSFKLLDTSDPAEVVRLKQAGAVAGKYYPRGATTHAEDGVSRPEIIFPTLEMMEKHDLVLCVHAEEPSAFCLDREAAFLPVIERIVRTFPALRIVIEHVTTAAAVETVRSLPSRVAATVTVHHLYLTLDDVIGGFIRPHHFCKPVAKRPEDREALRSAVLESHPRFFFGSDSAPHPRDQKECAEGCAGIYTAPVAIPLLAEFFSRALPHGLVDGRPSWLNALEAFTSVYGRRFYGLPPGSGSIEIVEEPWTVPHDSGGVTPFFAGQTLSRRVE